MLSPIPEILDELRAGRMIVLCDDEGRENEGDLVLPAQFVTPEAITFMLSAARGYMCLSLTEDDCDRLELHPQAQVNTSVRGTPMTVSIDGHPVHGFTTGVSAMERARTILMAIDPQSRPSDFVRPGHINPLRSRRGGVLVRTGQTEGSVDLCRLAGLRDAALIIEIMRDDGEMARRDDLKAFVARHGLKMCSVAQIIEYRLARESLIRRCEPVLGTPIATKYGDFTLHAFESVVDPLPHVVLTAGDVGRLDSLGNPVESDEPTLVRMHRRHLLGDIFGDIASSMDGATCDALHASMRLIHQTGRGAIVYMRPEGVGDDLAQRLQTIRRVAYAAGGESPDLTHPDGVGASALPMDLREFGIGGQILRALGIRRLRLLTNSQKSLPGLDAFGLEIEDRVEIPSVRRGVVTAESESDSRPVG